MRWNNREKRLKKSVYFWDFFHLVIHREMNIPFQSMNQIMERWIKQRADTKLQFFHVVIFSLAMFFYYIGWWFVKSNKMEFSVRFYKKRNIIYDICLSPRDRMVLSRQCFTIVLFSYRHFYGKPVKIWEKCYSRSVWSIEIFFKTLSKQLFDPLI